MKKCFEYQELISALIDGELTEAERSELDAHLAGCPSCRAYLEILTAISGGELVEPPAALCENVMAAARKTAPVKKKKHRDIGRWIAAAACFALVIVAAPRFMGGCGSSSDMAAPADPKSAPDGAGMYSMTAPSGGEASGDRAVEDGSVESFEFSNGVTDEAMPQPSTAPQPDAEAPEPAPDTAGSKNFITGMNGLPSAGNDAVLSESADEYEAVVTLRGELPDILAEYVLYSNSNGTFDIIVPDTLLPELLLLDADVEVNSAITGGEILVIYAP